MLLFVGDVGMMLLGLSSTASGYWICSHHCFMRKSDERRECQKLRFHDKYKVSNTMFSNLPSP